MQGALTAAYAADTDTSELIGSIYDAAVTPGAWPKVLDACCRFIGGTSASIFGKNLTGNRSAIHFTDGRLDPEAAHAYFGGGLAAIDPSNGVQVMGDIGCAIITSRSLEPDDFLGSRLAREWALPNGLIDAVVAPVERRGTWATIFGVLMHEDDGFGTESMRERVAFLAPHVQRAVSIAGIIGQTRSKADTFREAIDGLAAGVLLVDAEGRLVHANDAGRALLGTSHTLAAGHGGPLRLDRTRMRDLVPRDGHFAAGSHVIETADGEQYVAHVLPLTGGDRQVAGVGGDAAAALFVQPATFDPPSIPLGLAKAFDLTPAELRVALATLRHDKVAEVAETLGVAETTVKTHLSRVFAKTDTKRQADIVKLVAAFASPLAR